MKRLITLAVVTVALLFAPQAAQADSRISATATIIKVMPGGGNIFAAGDPIRVCAGVQTGRAVDGQATMAIEERAARADATWHELVRFNIDPNKVVCMLAVVRGHGEFKLRTRVLRREGWNGSKSRTVVVHVAPRGSAHGS